MREHSIAILKGAVCPILNVDPDAALERVPWSSETRANADFGVSAADFMALWDTLISLAPQPVDTIYLGRTMANGPVVPVFLAFSCAPNFEQGLQRLSRYKSLFGPVALVLSRCSGRLRVEVASAFEQAAVPSSLAIPIAVFVVEKARSCSGRHVVPHTVTMPDSETTANQMQAFFGVAPSKASEVSLEFSAEDASTPLLSANEDLWRELEGDLERQLAAREGDLPFATRVEVEIRVALNLGAAQVDTICRRLNVSRSTLQRRLNREDETFQEILDRVRADLAKRYLLRTRLSPTEIAGLLGFSDPKSFHRASRAWLGTTPEKFRAMSG